MEELINKIKHYIVYAYFYFSFIFLFFAVPKIINSETTSTNRWVLIGIILFLIMIFIFLKWIVPYLKIIKTKSNISKLIEQFETYGKSMVTTDTLLLAKVGDKSTWNKELPSRESIILVNKFLKIGRIDIPIKLLCEGIKRHFDSYHKMTPIMGVNRLEAQLRLFSAIIHLIKSYDLKFKVSIEYINYESANDLKKLLLGYTGKAQECEVLFYKEKYDEIVNDPLNRY